MAREFAAAHLEGHPLSGKELFALADGGDQAAQKAIDQMYDGLARGIVNLAVSFNPDKVLIGGGLSSRPDLLAVLTLKVEALVNQVQATDLVVPLGICQFNNQANLIGAVANFMTTLPAQV